MTRPEGMARAREMYGDGSNGWSIYAIQQYLARNGVAAGWVTVKRWVQPEFAEQSKRDAAARARRAYRDRHGITRPVVADADGLMRRIQALAGVNLSRRSIARVIALDHSVELTEGEVRYALEEGRPPRRLSEEAAA